MQLLATRSCTLAIIDTPASDSALATDAIGAADLCLIPARPSQADIEATQPTLNALRRYGKKFAFVLNQTPARSYRPTRAAENLSNMGILATPFIVQRSDHQDALAAGLAVSEFAPNGKAATEMHALWMWVKQKLKSEVPQNRQSPMTDVEHCNQQRTQNPFEAMVSNTVRFVCSAWIGSHSSN
jgi:chromosome partitioning protein